MTRDPVVAECAALTRYLIDREPSEYLIACYRRALPTAAPTPATAIDRVLLGAARLGRWPARMADGYARLARPTGDYRRRLTLTLALLENAPDTQALINDGLLGTPARVVAGLAASLAASAVAIVLGLVVFGPIHLVVGARPAPTTG